MTINIVVSCDSFGCDDSDVVDENTLEELEAIHFHLMPGTTSDHYCDSCKKALEQCGEWQDYF